MNAQQEHRLAEIRECLAAGRAAEARQRLDDWYPSLSAAALRAFGWQLDELYGACAFARADMEGAAYAYWQAMQHDSHLRSQLEHLSSYLFCLHYLPGISDSELAKQHFLYGRLLQEIPRYAHPRDLHASHEKVRIGYLSANFNRHAAADFMRPFFAQADRQRYETYAYALGPADAVTDSLRGMADHWCSLYSMAPADAAARIYADAPDILVDLGGHSEGGQTLMLMAYRPAPVQLSALGWVDTTGTAAMDYFLSDRCCAAELSPENFSEQIVRLERPHLCYAPLREMPPLPVYEPGQPIVFGSFNNFAKLTEPMLQCWCRLLAQVPESRLVLRDTTALVSRRQALRERLLRLGAPLERVCLQGAAEDYLRAYAGIAIALDTYPYPGGATTCEALYMGVPVITLSGTRHGSRLGASILGSLGLSALVAQTPEEYIEKAAALSHDRLRLAKLHAGLRSRMEKAVLMDGADYMRHLEAAYDEIWHAWLQQRP